MTDGFEKVRGEHGEIRAMPRPTQEELDTFYSKLYYSDGVTTTYATAYDEDELAQKRQRAAVTIEALLQNLQGESTSMKLLEVGSGEGFVLSAAAERGLQMTGVDYQAAPVDAFNPDIRDRFTASDPNLYLKERIVSGDRYDAIVLQNVLEHVRDPEGLLADLRTILADTGVLLVQIPNDFSALQHLATEKGRLDRETWFAPPQHLTYWNAENVRPYMAAQGYEIIDGFTDFPIETFLWGAPTNYSKDRTFGPHAHRGRVELDLFFARAGLEAYLDLYRSFYRVGFGRNIVVVMRKS